MESEDKVRNQNSFMSGECQVMVATSAFGMGVDKKDVGLVIHYDISDSLENYIQEAGRAGRDPNMNAECYVLYSDNDLDKHFILLNQTKLALSEIQQIWKVIKDLTQQRNTVSCSVLEIARMAGWGDDVADIETRVRAALAALENAGYISRGKNSPHLFATGITVKNMDEARRRLNVSPLFDDRTREESARIISSLISRRMTERNNPEAESRIEYLADILGMAKETVINSVNLMRQDGILADSQDMLVWVERVNLKRLLDTTLRLEQFLIQQITSGESAFNYKVLNQKAQELNLKDCTVRRLRTILSFLTVKGYIHKKEFVASENVGIQPLLDNDTINQRFEKRMEICRYIVETLGAKAVAQHKDDSSQSVPFSIIEVLNGFNKSHLLLGDKATIADVQESMLYLSRNDVLKIDGGFMVIYNTMQLRRMADRKARYGKEQYKTLDAFYQQRMQQIHIVGEYANLMVRDYNAALKFVNDYFTLDYRQFINHYFKGNRRTEITRNITPNKFRQLFGTLSPKQREIFDDKDSRVIVVAAGPGSGKTRVLVHKLASLLLMEDVKHEQLLMLTFSRAAATEFKSRLIKLVGNAAHFVDIKTFHSYAFDLMGQLGSLEESDEVVLHAAEMIERGDVEESKIAKSVLVIDEAQDMAADEFRLVRALMKRNEDMRVIAVGDDDQNIYAFRGSDSAYMGSLVSEENARFYEMTENYRSDISIVNVANNFVQCIPNRMKSTPIISMQKDLGRVEVSNGRTFSVIGVDQLSGSSAVLTYTNEEALEVSCYLHQMGLHPLLIQSTDSFRFINLAEVRYFTKQLKCSESIAVSKEAWIEAKHKTEQAYATSKMLPYMHRFWEIYEKTHKIIYKTDLRQFLLESNVEDFAEYDDQVVYVSTIHKAKGREFDSVHLWLFGLYKNDADSLRSIYVGLTRAKHNLYIHSDSGLFGQKPSELAPVKNKRIILSLSLRDVWLDYFRDHKNEVLAMRSGDEMKYHDGYLDSKQGKPIASLSKSKREELDELAKKGYSVVYAEVSYVLAWRPRDEKEEVAVCLANLQLEKQ